jgi:hypothetical protein
MLFEEFMVKEQQREERDSYEDHSGASWNISVVYASFVGYIHEAEFRSLGGEESQRYESERKEQKEFRQVSLPLSPLEILNPS